jgi:hypothetical protein
MLIGALLYKSLTTKSNRASYVNYIEIKLGLNALLRVIRKASYNKVKCI